MRPNLTGGTFAKLGSGPRVSGDLSRVSAGLGRGASQKNLLENPAWSGTWPAPGSTVDLDFVNDLGFIRGVGSGRSMDAVTFTRASNATYVGSDGLLKGSQGSGRNLIPTIAQEFGSWSSNRVGIASNVAFAPDGTYTADSITPNSTNAGHDVNYAANLGSGSFVFSVYVKANGYPRAGLRVYDGTAYRIRATFDIVSGTIVSTEAGSSSIEDAGNGWWRISCAGTSPSGSMGTVAGWVIESMPGNVTIQTAFAGDGISGAFLWGAQIETGLTLTTYFPTNINTPRFDWSNTVPLSTNNLFKYTENFNNSYWTVVNQTFSGTTTAPDGTTLYLVTENTTNGVHAFRPTSLTGLITRTDTYTVSYIVKSNGRRYCNITYATTTSNSIRVGFDLQSGVISGNVVSSLTGVSGYANIEDLTNGYYRISLTATGLTTSTLYGPILYLSTTGLTGNNNQDTENTYIGDGVSGIYVGAAQITLSSIVLPYQSVGAFNPINIPLTTSSTCNGLMMEESRTNRIRWCRDASQTPNRNLLTYSEQFNNAIWTNVNITVSADATIAPDGTTTADLTYPTSTSTTGTLVRQATSTGAIGGNYTFSVYLKPSGFNWAFLSIANTGQAQFVRVWFDLANGLVGGNSTSAFTLISSSITLAANGFYRCTLTVIPTGLAQTLTVFYGLADSNNSITATASGTNGVYGWGAQLDFADTASTYEKTIASASIWSKQGITAIKDQTGIDGATNAATSLTATINNAVCSQVVGLASGSRTASVYLKRISGIGNVQVSLDGSTWSTVDLSSTEWRRIVLSATVTNPVIGIRLATNGDSVAMDYAQIEDGTYATTPILTTSVTATRSADVGNISPARFSPNNFAYNKGTLFGWFVPNYFGTQINGSSCGVSLRDSVGNGNNNNIRVGNNGNAVASCGVVAGGSNAQLNLTGNSSSSEIKYAVSFTGATVAAAISGTGNQPLQVASMSLSGSSQPLLNSVVFSLDNIGGTVYTMYIKRIIFDDRFANVDSLRSIVTTL